MYASSYIVYLGSTLTIPLSLYSNTCGCLIWLDHITPSLGFITLYSTPRYIINPGLTNFASVGTYTVRFYTCDRSISLTFCSRESTNTFIVYVRNLAPAYSITPSYSTYPGISSQYVLPSKSDYEGHSITQTVGASPAAFIVFNIAIDGFDISPTSQSDVGTYPITLTLTDQGGASRSYTCMITVLNRAPIWTGSMTSMSVPVLISRSQNLPSVSDLDPGAAITISSVCSPTCTHTTSTSGGITTLTVTPASSAEIGSHYIYLTASDGYTSISISVYVSIYNTAPYFATTLQSSFTAYLNQVSNYPLPAIADPEGHAVTASCSSSSFITFSGNVLTFSPVALTLLSTSTSITVTLTDAVGATRSYSMLIIVPNRAPYFIDGTTSFGSVSVSLNSVQNFAIPPFSDLDLETPVLSISQASIPTVSVALSGPTSLTISPTTFIEVGTRLIYIQLSDYRTTVKFPLSIVVTNTAPYISSPLMPFPNKIVALNKQITIPFAYADLEGNPITVTVYETFSGTKIALPSAISTVTSPGQITVSPKLFSHLGLHLIEIRLSDGQPLTRTESFTINVVNLCPYFINQIPFSVTMKFNLTYEYILPPMGDGEGNTIHYYLTSTPPVNLFTKKASDRFFFNPTLWTQLGTYKLQLILSDLQANSTPYNFTLTVTNSPPRFQSKKPSDQKLQLNKELVYMLPSIIDDENNPILLVTTTIPNFVTFKNADKSYQIAPVNPANCLGVFNVKGYLSDSKLTTDFEFKIEVYNNPPKFKYYPRNLKASILVDNKFELPFGDDEEGLPLKYKVTQQNGSPLPYFMKYIEIENSLYVMTEQQKDLGTYQLQMFITDGYSNPISGKFTLTVEDPIKTKKKKGSPSDQVDQKKVQQVKATIAITKIQRDGILNIAVFALQGSQEIAAAIDNETLAFSIPTKAYQKVNFTIESYNPIKAEIKIKLNFTDPNSISSQMDLDILEVITTQEINIQTEKCITILKYQSSAKKEIPPQIIECKNKQFKKCFQLLNLLRQHQKMETCRFQIHSQSTSYCKIKLINQQLQLTLCSIHLESAR